MAFNGQIQDLRARLDYQYDAIEELKDRVKSLEKLVEKLEERGSQLS